MYTQSGPRFFKRLTRTLLIEQLEERCLLSYSVTDLGTLPGLPSSKALGINLSGQVVGECDANSGSDHAFLWDSTNGM